MLGAASRLPVSRPTLIPSRTYAISLKPPVVYPRKTVPRVYSERKTYLYNQYTRLLQSTSTAPLILFEHVDFSANRLIKLRADIAAAVAKHAKTPSLGAPSPTPHHPRRTADVHRPAHVHLRRRPPGDEPVRHPGPQAARDDRERLARRPLLPHPRPAAAQGRPRVLARAVPPRKPKTQQQIDDEKKAAEAAFVPGRRPKRQRPTPVPDLKLLGAIIEGRPFMAEGVQSVAELPTLDALRAQIVGLLSAPAAQLSMVLSEASGGKLARTLEGFKKSLEPEGQDGQAEAPPS
ncbi:hypothetical protein C8T65DRAFT_652292 [Cerioporus squamosus]|nr:hypothetical protein C8T65DRAFT_652292 [Cerioporus squamosus]